jgi:hypothetical protein
MGVWKSNTIVYYQITRLPEQKYRLAIPFALQTYCLCNSLVRIPIKNTIQSVICKPVSSNLHLLSRYFHFSSGCELEDRNELTQPEIRLKIRKNNAMFLTKSACTIYVRKVYKHDESWVNTCLWEGERKYTRYILIAAYPW